MARTTINIDDPVLRDLKQLQKLEGKSLGQLISELLGQVLAQQRKKKEKPRHFHWSCRAMNARIDLEDKDALYAALDGPKQ